MNYLYLMILSKDYCNGFLLVNLFFKNSKNKRAGTFSVIALPFLNLYLNKEMKGRFGPK